MTIRLNKVARDLNVGIQTAVDFLQKKGFSIESNPNTKISDEQYALLVKEFSTDKKIHESYLVFLVLFPLPDKLSGDASCIDGKASARKSRHSLALV